MCFKHSALLFHFNYHIKNIPSLPDSAALRRSKFEKFEILCSIFCLYTDLYDIVFPVKTQTKENDANLTLKIESVDQYFKGHCYRCYAPVFTMQ